MPEVVKQMEKKRAAMLKRKIEALRRGEEPQIDLREVVLAEYHGAVPGPDFRAVLELARLYQWEEDPSYWVISWANQERAAMFFNAHGLAATLDECARIEKGR